MLMWLPSRCGLGEEKLFSLHSFFRRDFLMMFRSILCCWIQVMFMSAVLNTLSNTSLKANLVIFTHMNSPVIINESWRSDTSGNAQEYLGSSPYVILNILRWSAFCAFCVKLASTKLTLSSMRAGACPYKWLSCPFLYCICKIHNNTSAFSVII